MIRIGQGYDVHKFGEGDAIIIGGVTIPHTKALIAYSDGDVLLHAICDALLGAASEHDIGHHFPDTDPVYKNFDSRKLLKHVYKLVKNKGYQIINIDTTIIAQAPKISPYTTTMQQYIADDLQTDTGNINIKATTTEELGFEGREEGIAAQAICLIEAI